MVACEFGYSPLISDQQSNDPVSQKKDIRKSPVKCTCVISKARPLYQEKTMRVPFQTCMHYQPIVHALSAGQESDVWKVLCMPMRCSCMAYIAPKMPCYTDAWHKLPPNLSATQCAWTPCVQSCACLHKCSSTNQASMTAAWTATCRCQPASLRWCQPATM